MSVARSTPTFAASGGLAATCVLGSAGGDGYRLDQGTITGLDAAAKPLKVSVRHFSTVPGLPIRE